MGEFVKVARVQDIPDGQVKQFWIADDPIAVIGWEGEFWAVGDICSHEHAHLSEGFVEDGLIECPLHGARFDIKTGAQKLLPATRPVPSYQTKVENAWIYVEVPDEGE